MSFYQASVTWKVVYYPKDMSGGRKGVALVEAPDHPTAMYNFQREYAGEFQTIISCKQLLE